MNSSKTVEAELGLRLVVPEHDGVPLTASLHYRGDDPYAVRMAFHVGMDEPVEWIFARDLLAEGLTEPAGEGDVRVWPAATDNHRVLNISLSSPFGQAHFEAPLSALAGFLLRTFQVIPAGHYFMMGDCRGDSDDSRYWGTVPASNIVGKVDVIIWRHGHPWIHWF